MSRDDHVKVVDNTVNGERVGGYDVQRGKENDEIGERSQLWRVPRASVGNL